MKGKDNTFYMKDNLLREQGVITDLEARLQAKEEFMEQYHVRQENEKRIPTETERIFNEEEALRPDDADEGKVQEAIEVEKAQRRKDVETGVIADIEADVEDLLQALKEQTELPENNVKAINKRFDDFLIPEKRTPATRKGMNNLIKELKKGMPINVKLITKPMTEDDITKTIKDVKEQFNNFIETKARIKIQTNYRRHRQKGTILKKAEEKLKEIESQRSQMFAKTRADTEKTKVLISQRKPKTAEDLAREQETKSRELAVAQGGLASTGRARRLTATEQTIPGPPPPIPTAPTAGAQAEPTPADTADDAIWTDTDTHLEDLKAPMKTLLTELQSLNTPNSRVDAKYIGKLNRVASLIDRVDSIDPRYRTKVIGTTKVEKAIEILNASLSYLDRKSPHKAPREGVSTRGTTVAGGGVAGGGQT